MAATESSGPGTLQVFYLFAIITGVFIFLMIVVGVSFKLIKNNVDENTPEDIKKFHTTYLLGIIQVVIIYLYFLVLCYALRSIILGVSLFAWVFIFVNIATGFIVLVFAADATKKIKEMPNKDKYNDYLDLMTLLLVTSSALLAANLLWLATKLMGGSKKITK